MKVVSTERHGRAWRLSQASRLRPRTNSMAMKISWSISDLVDGDDVGVGQTGHRLRLAEQAGAAVVVLTGGLAAQHLDGDFAVELVVVRGVHDAHATLAQAVENGEAADLDGLGPVAKQAGLDEVLDAAVLVVGERST
jgi:hypothetical protein